MKSNIMEKTKRVVAKYGFVIGIFLCLIIVVMHSEVFGSFKNNGLIAEAHKNAATTKVDNNPKADFNLKLVNDKGEQVNMEQFKGKVIFLNLWATWCPPCIAEMPGINDLFNEVKGEDIVFLMLSLDQDFEKAKKFKNKKGFDFDVYKVNGNIPAMYYSQSIPTTFVIDAKGDLALTHIGMADYNTPEFKAFLRGLK